MRQIGAAFPDVFFVVAEQVDEEKKGNRLNPNLLAGTSPVILQGDFRGVSVKITVYIGIVCSSFLFSINLASSFIVFVIGVR